MDEQHQAAKWQFNSDTQDAGLDANGFAGHLQELDGLWDTFNDVDFQPLTHGISTTTPSHTNDLNSFQLLDDFPTDNFTPTGPLNVPIQEDVFDLSTLQNLVQERPAPRQHTLPRRRSKYILRRAGSNTSPITIPSSRQNPPFQPVAIERWQNSPPEDEAASLSAIYNAMEQRPLSGSGSHTPNFDQYRSYRVPSSTTSLDSGVSESSIHSANSKESSKSQRRRRSNKTRTTAVKGKAKPKDVADRIFKCTFCCDTFKHKYDWSRHEKSLHLNMEEWVCAPHVSWHVLLCLQAFSNLSGESQNDLYPSAPP
jgi:hypothetical protein